MNQYRTIVLPRHPEDDHIPDSIIKIALPGGRIVTITGPIFSKSMEMLSDTLKNPLMREAMCGRESDYQI